MTGSSGTHSNQLAELENAMALLGRPRLADLGADAVAPAELRLRR